MDARRDARVLPILESIQTAGYDNFLDFMISMLRSEISAVRIHVDRFIGDIPAINRATKILHDKSGALGGDTLMKHVKAKLRNEVQALEKSPFFRQSPVAQDLYKLSYQRFDDEYDRLAPFTRAIIRHLCGVDELQTVDNPGKGPADDDEGDIDADEMEEGVPEGALAGGIEGGLDLDSLVRGTVNKSTRRRNKAMIATAAMSVTLFGRSQRCNYFQVSRTSYNGAQN